MSHLILLAWVFFVLGLISLVVLAALLLSAVVE